MFEMDKDALRYGVTALENRFILDYLPTAKGDYVKVYLWGLMHARQPGEEFGLEEMAQELFLTVSDIEAALRYWERRSLVSRIREQPPLYRFYSPLQRETLTGKPLEVDQEYVSFAENVYAIFGDRRKITPAEISLAWEWVQDIGLKTEAVLMLLNYCIKERGIQFSLKRAEPLAVRMKEDKVESSDDAEHFLHHHQKVHQGARSVLSRLGQRRSPSDDELTLYEKWTDEWQFDPQAILNACAETTAAYTPTFKYLDGILERLRENAPQTGDQVKRRIEREKADTEKAREIFSCLSGHFTAPVLTRLYDQFTQVYPHSVLLLAARECQRTGKGLEDMQSLLASWQEKGLKTEQDVTEYLNRFREANAALRRLFEACGHRGKPTAADRTLYEKWKGWQIDDALMQFAAEQARAAEGSKIAYLDKVLETWHEAGITDISQARAQKPAEKKKTGKTVSAQQYGQRDYTEEELLAISDDLIEEARKRRE